MTWRFDGMQVDRDRAELIGPDGAIRIERLPFDLLIYLIENRERVVSHDELTENIWGGRIVSDSTIATAVKQVRKAVGDNGTDQAIIRTVHRRGFRFVGNVDDNTPTIAASPNGNDPTQPVLAGVPIQAGVARPSIAALRFQYLGSDPSFAGLATAFPTELLSSLSRMRWLQVISRGSSFQFDPSEYQPQDVGKTLGVRYLVTGMIEVDNNTIAISVELQSTQDGEVVWSERFSADLCDIQHARHGIVASVVSVLELELPKFEAGHSRRLRPAELDAWSHFHLGLTHIYKFREDNNQIATAHFRTALKLDPYFARAHAGLSFTHWQNAFMRFGEDRDQLVSLAVASAEAALDIDPSDPFSAFNMGRARWLEGEIDGSQVWLDRALHINPNYAQCHYNMGLIQALEGVPYAALASTNTAVSLSPLDPLQYAMLSVQAMSKIMLEEFDAARLLTEKAIQSPGAHFYIALIAACAEELEGRRGAAERRLYQARVRRPDVTIAMFLQAFPFRDKVMRQTMVGALNRLGLAA